MTNPTSNYSWVLPNSADLVTDLPADFDVALQGVDTRLKALQPGTTLGDLAYSSATANTNTRLGIGTAGQVLSVVAGVPAWTTGTAGDIEGVTAGTGISGGGTSGTVTVTNSMATAITTAGDLIKGTGSGTFDRLGIGSTGQVLTVASGAPSWATPASGGMTEIASGSLSSTLVLISSIPTTYNSLRLVVRNFKPITDNANMRMRFNNDSTANRHLADSVSTGLSGRAFDATFSPISYSADNTSAEGTAVIDIPDYANTTTWKSAFIFSLVNSGTTPTTANAIWDMQGYNQTAAITSLGLLAEGSGFTSGTYILWGVK